MFLWGFIIKSSGQKERLELIYDKDKAREYRTVLDATYSRTHHSHVISGLIRSICPKQKSSDFKVLDLGCGTGRYFPDYCNASTITGIDISRHMVEEARERVASEGPLDDAMVTQADILEYEIKKDSYDLIVSIGTLGEYCPLTKEVVQKAAQGLRPGGIMLFSVFDADHCLKTRLRTICRKEPMARVIDTLQPHIPSRMRRTYSRLFYTHYVRCHELDEILSGHDGLVIDIGRLRCPRNEWNGTHLVVMVCKPPVKNLEPQCLFGDLLETVKGNQGQWDISGALLPLALLAFSEYDELMASFFSSGAL